MWQFGDTSFSVPFDNKVAKLGFVYRHWFLLISSLVLTLVALIIIITSHVYGFDFIDWRAFSPILSSKPTVVWVSCTPEFTLVKTVFVGLQIFPMFLDLLYNYHFVSGFWNSFRELLPPQLIMFDLWIVTDVLNFSQTLIILNE
jgi:hypothetical protein